MVSDHHISQAVTWDAARYVEHCSSRQQKMRGGMVAVPIINGRLSSIAIVADVAVGRHERAITVGCAITGGAPMPSHLGYLARRHDDTVMTSMMAPPDAGRRLKMPRQEADESPLAAGRRGVSGYHARHSRSAIDEISARRCPGLRNDDIIGGTVPQAFRRPIRMANKSSSARVPSAGGRGAA